MFFGVVLAGLIGLAGGGGEALVLPLLATQILWINLVTDSFPALAVGVDPPDPALMRRAPRDPAVGVITPRMWAGICVAAVVIATGTLARARRRAPRRTDRRRRVGRVRPHARVHHAGPLSSSTTCSAPVPTRRPRCTGLSATAGCSPRSRRAGAAGCGRLHRRRCSGRSARSPLDAADWLFCAAIASTIVVAREAGKAWWRGVDRRNAGTLSAATSRRA